jgi:transcriptional regulator with XRE-family HTH domain
MKLQSGELGATLRRLRRDSGLTQGAASAAAAMSRSRLAAIECGHATNLELGTLQKLLDVYGAELHVEARSPRRTLNQILREQTKR